MPGLFDDLDPGAEIVTASTQGAGLFDDLAPDAAPVAQPVVASGAGLFDDLVSEPVQEAKPNSYWRSQDWVSRLSEKAKAKLEASGELRKVTKVDVDTGADLFRGPTRIESKPSAPVEVYELTSADRGAADNAKLSADDLEARINNANERARRLRAQLRAAESDRVPPNAMDRLINTGLGEILDMMPENSEQRKRFMSEVSDVLDESTTLDMAKKGGLAALEKVDKYVFRPYRSLVAGTREALGRQLSSPGEDTKFIDDFMEAFTVNQYGKVAEDTEDQAFKKKLSAVIDDRPMEVAAPDAGDPYPYLRMVRSGLESATIGSQLINRASGMPESTILSEDEIKGMYDDVHEELVKPTAAALTRVGYSVVLGAAQQLPGVENAGRERRRIAAEEAVNAGSHGAMMLLDLGAAVATDPTSYLKFNTALRAGGVAINRRAAPFVERYIEGAVGEAQAAVREGIAKPVAAAASKVEELSAKHRDVISKIADIDSGVAEGSMKDRAVLRIKELDLAADIERAEVALADMRRAAEGADGLVRHAGDIARRGIGEDMLGLSNFALKRGLPMEGVDLLRVWKTLTRDMGLSVDKFADELAAAMSKAKAEGKVLKSVSTDSAGKLVFESAAPVTETVNVARVVQELGTSKVHTAAEAVRGDVSLVSALDAGLTRATVAVYNALPRSMKTGQVMKVIEGIRRNALGITMFRRPQPLAGYTTDGLYRAFAREEIMHPEMFRQAVLEPIQRRGPLEMLINNRRRVIVQQMEQFVPTVKDREQVIGLLDLGGVSPAQIRAAEGIRAAEKTLRDAVRSGAVLDTASLEDARLLISTYEDTATAIDDILSGVLGTTDSEPTHHALMDALDSVEILKQDVLEKVRTQLVANSLAEVAGRIGAASDVLAELQGVAKNLSGDGSEVLAKRLEAAIKQLQATSKLGALDNLKANAQRIAEVITNEAFSAYDTQHKSIKTMHGTTIDTRAILLVSDYVAKQKAAAAEIQGLLNAAERKVTAAERHLSTVDQAAPRRWAEEAKVKQLREQRDALSEQLAQVTDNVNTYEDHLNAMVDTSPSKGLLTDSELFTAQTKIRDAQTQVTKAQNEVIVAEAAMSSAKDRATHARAAGNYIRKIDELTDAQFKLEQVVDNTPGGALLAEKMEAVAALKNTRNKVELSRARADLATYKRSLVNDVKGSGKPKKELASPAGTRDMLREANEALDSFEHIARNKVKNALIVSHDSAVASSIGTLSSQEVGEAIRLARSGVPIPKDVTPEAAKLAEYIRKTLMAYAKDLKQRGLLASDDITTDELIQGIDVSRLLPRFKSDAEASRAQQLAGGLNVSPFTEPKRLVVHKDTLIKERVAQIRARAEEAIELNSAALYPDATGADKELLQAIDSAYAPSEGMIDDWIADKVESGADLEALVIDPVPLMADFLSRADKALVNTHFLDDQLTRFPRGAEIAKEYGHAGDVVAQAEGYRRLSATASARARGLQVPAWLEKHSARIHEMLGKGMDEVTILKSLGLEGELTNPVVAGVFEKPVYLPLPSAEYIDWYYGSVKFNPSAGSDNALIAAYDGLHAWAKTMVTIGRTMYGYLAVNVVGNLTSQGQVLREAIHPKYITMGFAVQNATEGTKFALNGREVLGSQVRQWALEDGIATVASSSDFLMERGVVATKGVVGEDALRAFGEGLPISGPGGRVVPTLELKPLLLDDLGDAIMKERGTRASRAAVRAKGAAVGAVGGGLTAGPFGAVLGGVGGAAGATSKRVLDEVLAEMVNLRALTGKEGVKAGVQAGATRLSGAGLGALYGSVVGGPVGALAGGVIGGITMPGTLRLMGELNASVENMARMQTYLAALDKGFTRAEAVEITNKALRDYGAMTPFERNLLRRGMYFYSWSAGNIKLQTEWAVKNPGKMAIIAKVLDGLYSGTYSDEDLARFPPFQRWQIVAQVNRGRFMKNWVLPKMPYTEPLEILEAGVAETLHDRANPAFGWMAGLFGQDWERDMAQIDMMASANSVGVRLEDVDKLPKAFRDWIGLLPQTKYTPGFRASTVEGGPAVPRFRVTNPYRWWLVQQLPIWSSLSVYLKTMTSPWVEEEEGPVPGMVSRSIQLATGVREQRAPAIERVLQIRQWRIEKILREEALKAGVAGSDVYIRRPGMTEQEASYE